MELTGPYYKAYLDHNDGQTMGKTIGNLIAAAKQSLDISVYDISRSEIKIPTGPPSFPKRELNIVEGILCAVSKGVQVRLVVDWETYQNSLVRNPDKSPSSVGNLYNTI